MTELSPVTISPPISTMATNNMDIQENIKNVKELEQTYIKQCKATCNSLKASYAFRAWYKELLVLFNRHIPSDNEDFQYIKNKGSNGNGYTLKIIYDDISARCAMLIDNIESGRLSEHSQEREPKALTDAWSLIHPQIAEVSYKRMNDGYYADAVEAACKAVNSLVRRIVLEQTGEELDGAGLMKKAFSPANPIIRIANVENKSGHDIQQGYMEIFAGVMTGIRNPKAHDNETITEEDALRKLIMISLLMYKIDSRIITE